MWPSTSLASCVENIHNVNSSICSSLRLLEACLVLFARADCFEDEFDFSLRGLRFFADEIDVPGSSSF